jgi:hypothetical protein
VAQIYPEQRYDHDLAARAVAFLQTRDSALFPFTIHFDDARMKAFLRDLREALAEITDSGSARKTSAAGFITRDRRLHDVIAEWAMAEGDWPSGTNPRNPVTALGSTEPV